MGSRLIWLVAGLSACGGSSSDKGTGLLDDTAQQSGDDTGGTQQGGDDSGQQSGDDSGQQGGDDTAWDDTGTLACSVEGRAYAWDLAGANWVEPAGVGSLLSGYLTDPPVLGVTAADSTSIDLVVGTSGGSSCTTLPTGDFTRAPHFEVGPTNMDLDFNGTTVTAYNASISGTFTSDCSGTTDGDIQGQLDMRELAPLSGYDADTLCSLLGGFGVNCDPCDSDGQSYCVNVHVTDIIGTETDPLSCI